MIKVGGLFGGNEKLEGVEEGLYVWKKFIRTVSESQATASYHVLENRGLGDATDTVRFYYADSYEIDRISGNFVLINPVSASVSCAVLKSKQSTYNGKYFIADEGDGAAVKGRTLVKIGNLSSSTSVYAGKYYVNATNTVTYTLAVTDSDVSYAVSDNANALPSLGLVGEYIYESISV